MRGRNGMKSKSRYWGIVALGVVLAAGVACGKSTPTGGKGSTTPPPPSTTTFTETSWTVATPAGWTREDITTKADAKKAIRYKDSSGNYFIVAIDPLGSDYRYDALWTYAVKGSGFEVVKKVECKSTTDEACSDKDTRYDGYILWKTGTNPPKVAGHTWYFVFGNATKTTIDASIFEQIATSVRVKA
jgi:hypothetical protein